MESEFQSSFLCYLIFSGADILYELVMIGVLRRRILSRSMTDCLSWYFLAPTIPSLSHAVTFGRKAGSCALIFFTNLQLNNKI
jgi:hypothetical protein